MTHCFRNASNYSASYFWRIFYYLPVSPAYVALNINEGLPLNQEKNYNLFEEKKSILICPTTEIVFFWRHESIMHKKLTNR